MNGLAPYYTMFPLSFPFDALANSKADEWVVDPFCGCGGTSLGIMQAGFHVVAALGNGCPATGFAFLRRGTPSETPCRATGGKMGIRMAK